MAERKQKAKPLNVIGPQLRKLRYQQGLTQPQLAAKCQTMGYDLSRESLAKIESRLRGVSDYELIALSFALGVSYKVLFPEEKLVRAMSQECYSSDSRKNQ